MPTPTEQAYRELQDVCDCFNAGLFGGALACGTCLQPLQGEETAMLIVLHKHDPARNQHRFYTLQVAPNLFGAWSLIRIWGRIGTPGQQRASWHDTRESAEQACDRLVQAKQRRGYVTMVTEFSRS
jgi:predicted DNA-binding WGR domain protein